MTIRRIRQCLLAACVCAGVLCPPAVAAAPPRAEAEYALVTLDRELEFRERVTVGLAPSTPGLAEIARYGENSERRRQAVIELLERLGGEDQLPPLGGRVTLDVWDARAHLRWGATRTLREPDDAPPWDRRVEEPGSASFTQLLRDGEHLRVVVGRPVGPAVASEIRLRVDPGRIRAAAPLPAAASPQQATWRLPAGGEPVTVRASVDLDASTVDMLKRNDDGRAVATSASNAIGPVLLLVLVFVLAGGAVLLRRFAVAAIGFTWAAIGASVTLIARDGVPFLRDQFAGHAGEALLTAVPVALPLAAAVALAGVAIGAPRPAGIGGVVLALVLGAGLAVLATAPTPVEPRPGVLGDIAGVTWAGALVPLVLCGALAATLVARLAKEPLHPRLPSWGAVAIAATIGVGATVQYVLATQALDLPSEERRWWELLPFFSQFSAVSISTAFIPLLPALATLVALPWLRSCLQGRAAAAWTPAMRVVLVLFAGVVIGLGGRVEHIQLPLAFVLWLGLVWLVLRARPAAAEPTGQLTAAQHAAALLRAMKFEAARRHAAKLRTDLTAAGWNDTAAETALAAEETRAAGLEALGDDAPTPAESGVATWRRALAVGPFDDPWRNGCAAARLGLYVAVVPVAYAWAVLIDRDGEQHFAADARDGLWVLLTQLAGEAATWIMLAFTFGVFYALLPGRTAMLKAGVFALVLGVGLALADVLSGPPDDTWPVRAFQMSLFLVVVGVLLDRRTLAARGVSPGHLPALYRLRDLRFAAGYIPTVVLLVLTVVQQLVSGEAQNAVLDALQGLTGVLPPGPGR